MQASELGRHDGVSLRDDNNLSGDVEANITDILFQETPIFGMCFADICNVSPTEAEPRLMSFLEGRNDKL